VGDDKHYDTLTKKKAVTSLQAQMKANSNQLKRKGLQ